MCYDKPTNGLNSTGKIFSQRQPLVSVGGQDQECDHQVLSGVVVSVKD